ncbi:MAG: hypothetical protein DRH24_05945 [Deltaproteobacteria bacterium]|nr:MAG: hypothetical protein DRH24_05945 [Deltaproteobacteria bacterium]
MRKNNRRHIVDIRKGYFFRITCLRRGRGRLAQTGSPHRQAQRSGKKTINRQTHNCIAERRQI